MIVKINGIPIMEPAMAINVQPIIKNKFPILTMLAGAAASVPQPDLASALMPIVSMIQDLAFPIGLGMGIWGLIEFIMDNPSGKQKVKRAFIGYIGIFILPIVFLKLKAAFALMIP